MKIIFAAAGLAILTGCASGTINTLSESRYACNATGSFFDFSADNAVETTRATNFNVNRGVGGV
jgi:hypothetical protein